MLRSLAVEADKAIVAARSRTANASIVASLTGLQNAMDTVLSASAAAISGRAGRDAHASDAPEKEGKCAQCGADKVKGRDAGGPALFKCADCWALLDTVSSLGRIVSTLVLASSIAVDGKRVQLRQYRDEATMVLNEAYKRKAPDDVHRGVEHTRDAIETVLAALGGGDDGGGGGAGAPKPVGKTSLTGGGTSASLTNGVKRGTHHGRARRRGPVSGSGAGADATPDAHSDSAAAAANAAKRKEKQGRMLKRKMSVFIEQHGLEVSDNHVRGYLFKKNSGGFARRKFQQRYYVLRKAWLFAYRSKEDYENNDPPSQGIALVAAKFDVATVGKDVLTLTPKPEVKDGSEAIIVATEDDYLFTTGDIDKPKLPKPGRVWTLRAENGAARDVWVERIRDAPAPAPARARRASLMGSRGKDFAREAWRS